MVVNADAQDGLDAAERARSGYRGEWHPLLAAEEGPVGTWTMRTPDGAPYGVIQQLELGGERGYRAVSWSEHSADRTLVGYYRTLSAAAMATHRRHLASHGPRSHGPRTDGPRTDGPSPGPQVAPGPRSLDE